MEEEDKVAEEEADSAKADTTKSKPENTTSITNKTRRTHEVECLEEGEAIMPDPIDKTIPFSADILENSTTSRKTSKRRSESQLQPIDNSLITFRNPTTVIVEKCSR